MDWVHGVDFLKQFFFNVNEYLLAVGWCGNKLDFLEKTIFVFGTFAEAVFGAVVTRMKVDISM